MALVRAMGAEASATVTSDGTENTVVFSGHDALGDGGGWIDCRSFIFLTLYADVGAGGNDVTIEGKVTASAPTVDIQAPATTASDGFVATALDIKAYGFFRILEDGTDTQSNSFYLLLK